MLNKPNRAEDSLMSRQLRRSHLGLITDASHDKMQVARVSIAFVPSSGVLTMQANLVEDRRSSNKFLELRQCLKVHYPAVVHVLEDDRQSIRVVLDALIIGEASPIAGQIIG